MNNIFKIQKMLTTDEIKIKYKYMVWPRMVRITRQRDGMAADGPTIDNRCRTISTTILNLQF